MNVALAEEAGVWKTARGTAASRRTDLLASLVFGALIVVQICHHAMWRDEIQAWQIAAASSGPLDLFHRLRHEGHPGLWHLLLWVPSRLTADPRAMQLVQAVIGSGLMALIWLGSPFRFVEKLLLCCSYFFLFEYGVMSRSYGLGALLALAAVLVWTGRGDRHPLAWILLGLAANTSFYGALLAITLGGWSLLDRWLAQRLVWRRELSGIVLFGLLLLLAVATMLPVPGTVAAGQSAPPWSHERLILAMTEIVQAFVPIPYDLNAGFWDRPTFNSAVLYPLFTLPLLVLAGAALRLQRAMIYMLVLLAAAIALMGIAQVTASARHVGTLFVAFIGMAWIAADRGQLGRGAFVVLLGLNALGGMQALHGQTLGPFSQARATADWLRANGFGDSFIVGDSEAFAAPIAGYLGRTFYYPSCACEGTYIEWTRATADWSNQGREDHGVAVGDALRRLLSGRPSLILVHDHTRPSLTGAAAAGLVVRPLATFDGSLDTGENYTIYRVELAQPRDGVGASPRSAPLVNSP